MNIKKIEQPKSSRNRPFTEIVERADDPNSNGSQCVAKARAYFLKQIESLNDEDKNTFYGSEDLLPRGTFIATLEDLIFIGVNVNRQFRKVNMTPVTDVERRAAIDALQVFERCWKPGKQDMPDEWETTGEWWKQIRGGQHE